MSIVKKNQLFNRTKANFAFGLTVFGLMVFGVVMIYSTSVFVGERYFGDPTIFFKKQIISLILAFAVWLICQQVDYHLWKKWSKVLLAIVAVLLVVVLFFPARGGSHSWILFGPLQFQPSELAKLSLILYLATWFEKKEEALKSLNYGFGPFLIILVLFSLLLSLQPDIGTLIIIIFIAVSMYFIAGAPLYHFGLGGLVSLFFAWALIWQSDYRRERIMTFLNPDQGTLDSAYHLQNILIAIGSGGWWGLGFGQSRQKRLFLPEPHTDSIFPVIVEELGFVRGVLVLVAYLFLVIRGFQIALKAPDLFGRLVGSGIMVWISFQAVVNIGAMLNLIPLTGIPLPFISYGGSGLVALGAAVGILMNISKQIKK